MVNRPLCCGALQVVSHSSHLGKETTLSEDHQHKATQTLGKGMLIIIWITAIFMVMIMNDIKSQLEEINSKLTSCVRSNYHNDPARLQIVDAKDGKTVIYTIQRVPEPEDETMMNEDGTMPAAEPATKPAPANKPE